MTASDVLDDLVVGRTYEVVVTHRPGGAGGRFEYRLSRLVPLDARARERITADGHQVPADFTMWHSFATLTSPPCTDEQARDFALAWLTITEHLCPGAVDAVFHLPTSDSRVRPTT